MGKHLTPYQLGQINAWRSLPTPLSFAEIAKKLKKTKSTMSTAYYQTNRRGCSERKAGSGRPRETTAREDNHMVLCAKRDPFTTAIEIKNHLNLTCNVRTINRRLVEKGCPAFWTTSKPFISDVNIEKRLQFALAHQNWTCEDWKRVVFADEKKFMLRWNKKTRVRRPRGQRLNIRYLKPTVKSNKKINIFGSIGYYSLVQCIVFLIH